MNNNPLSLIIDLLINIQADQQALQSVIAEDYLTKEGIDNDFYERFKGYRNASIQASLAAIKANCIMTADINDVLKDLFTGPEDK